MVMVAAIFMGAAIRPRGSTVKPKTRLRFEVSPPHAECDPCPFSP
jgi:hypothetical protein